MTSNSIPDVWSPPNGADPTNPADVVGKAAKNSVKSFTIIFVVVVCVGAVLGFMFRVYKINRKSQPRTETPTFSVPPSSVNVEENAVHQQQHLVRTPGSPSTIQEDGVARGREIVELHNGFSPNKELVAMSIYTNLTPDQIIHTKSYCHESQLIGEGSFAKVYRGILQGKDLAIKKIEHRYNDTRKWVLNEVDLLQGKEHKNINRLYAWYIEANISYLVYMHISGCTLEDYLRGNCIGFPYSWKECFRMIMGIAEGIEFLHRNKILHVDIKPQNIMVDANDNEVKLVDFGFSRHVDWEGTHRSTDKIIGTKGYWAPEYCLNHKLSYKHDVFSFGIVVLEMITGERHVDNARSSSQFHIPGHVRYKIDNDLFEEVVDTRLKQDGWDRYGVENALAVANIALRCAHQDKEERPFMDVVVTELNSIMMNISNTNNTTLGLIEEELAIITHA